MDKISHREMRNRSAEILRRVEAGESIQVTNHGQVAAVIAPAAGTVLEGLVARGQARPARSSASAVSTIPRGHSAVSSSEIVADLRGRW